MVNVVACQVYMHSGRCSSQAGRSAFNTMVNAVACQVYMHSGRCSSQAGRSAFNTMVNAVACQDYMCILVGAADRLAGLHSTQWSMQLHVKSTCVFLWVQLTGWPVCTQCNGQCGCILYTEAMLCRKQLTGWLVCTQGNEQCGCILDTKAMLCRKQLTGWPVCTQCNGQCGCILDTKAMLCRKQLTGWPVCTQPGERCSSLARNKLSWAGLAHRRNILASLPENLMQSHFKNASNRPYHKCKESKVGGRHIRHAHDLFHKHFITSI